MASIPPHLILIGSFVHLLSFAFSFPVLVEHKSFHGVGRRCRSHQLGAVGSGSGSDDLSDDDGLVSISIQKQFPNSITPKQAKDAWMDHHWRKGGGLPVLIFSSDTRERIILPTLMKERLYYDEAKTQGLTEISYKVTDPGPFFPFIVPDTHSANVTFQSINQATVMNWNVTFLTTKNQKISESLTQWTVGTAATTVGECLALPRRLNVRTVIDDVFDPVFARKECLDFVWAEGGGLPLPPPIPFGQIMEEGGGSARRNLLRIPPLITESIVDTAITDEQTSFQYRLNRPGWTTFPFLLHTHIGRVSFASTKQGLVIDWCVEVRPYQIVKPIVEKLVEMTVSTLVRNLRVRLLEPNAIVLIKPPRGDANLTMGVESFGALSKATWLGGVLESHLSDKRSTIDQTLSLVQPWTWGRSGAGDKRDIVHFQWSDVQFIEDNESSLLDADSSD